MNMKKKCVGVLSGLFLLTTCVALPVSLSASAATAESVSYASENLKMTEGAATRMVSPYGLKFQATFTTEEAHEGNYGMLIVPYDYFAKAGVELAENIDYVTAFSTAYTEEKIAYEPIVVEGLTVKKNDNGDDCIEHSIVELKESNFDRPFFGVAFEKVGDSYKYAPYNNNKRSIMQVASAALNKHYNTTGGKYGEAELAELNKFVSTGISNAYANGFEYAISGDGVTGVGYTTSLSVNEGLMANWSSNNEEVATVDKNGVVTGVSEGTATITAENYIGGEKKTATLDVTVKEVQTSTLTFANLGMADKQAFTSHSFGEITISAEKNAGTQPAYYTSGEALRLYQKNGLEISAAQGYRIVAAKITATSDSYIAAQSEFVSTTATAIVNGSTVTLVPKVNSIQFTVKEGAEAQRYKSIEVAYVPNGEATAIVEEKTLTELSAMEAYNGSYQVTGTITALNETTGAMTITDGTTSVEVLNSFNADGSLHYSLMEEKPAVGNEVTLIVTPNKTESGFEISSARIQSYREVQVSEAMKITITKAEIEGLQIEEDTVTVPVKGAQYEDIAIVWTSSNEAVLSINNATGEVTVNKPEATAEDVTVTLSAKVGADENEITFTVIVQKKVALNQDITLTLDITANAFGDADIGSFSYALEDGVIQFSSSKGGGTTATKYFASDYIRLYQRGSSDTTGLGGSITISCAEGFEISSIVFTTAKALTAENSQIDGATVEYADKTATLTLTGDKNTVTLHNKGTTTNQRIDITGIQIIYKKVA